MSRVNWYQHAESVAKAFKRPKTPKEAVTAGIHLLLLKEALPREQFLNHIQKWGIGYSTATNYMSMAKHFHDAPDAFFDAVGGMTKLGVLATLDCASVLVKGQSIGALSLDKIASMSLDELKVAVRKEEKSNQQTGLDSWSSQLVADYQRWSSTHLTHQSQHAPQPSGSGLDLSTQEQRLLEHYRHCEPTAQHLLLQMANLLNAQQPRLQG